MSEGKDVMGFDFHQAASMVRNQLEMSIGVRVKCAHLESEAGKKLNGLEGVVTGVGTLDECAAAVNGGPPFRVHVKLDAIADGKKFRMLNLLRPNYRSGEPGKATVPTVKARELLTRALEAQGTNHADLAERPDMLDRVLAAKEWLEATTDRPTAEDGGHAQTTFRSVGRCGLLGRPPPGKPCIEAVMQQVAPGCSGDGTVVFERFGDGLVGAGGRGLSQSHAKISLSFMQNFHFLLWNTRLP